MLDNIKVYLFSAENKDNYCLEPTASHLAREFKSVDVVRSGEICDKMAEFSVDPCPVAIFSSLSAYDYAMFARGGRPFVSIGLEHGVAPFKTYTFNPRFVEYDCYVSPTALWGDRLARLNPRYAKKFENVAYPRLDDLAARIDRQGEDLHPAWGGASPKARDLVIFSWGVEFSALYQMPDRAGVVYLVHPAMAKKAKDVRLQEAQVVVSTPDAAASLIRDANRIFGDFSSMTLEAAAFKERTYMFVDRRFYSTGCDLKPDFFVRDRPGFGRVESTTFSLPAKHVLNFDGLAKALSGKAVPVGGTIRAWAPRGLLPEVTGDHSLRTAQVISQVVRRVWPEKHEFGLMSPSLRAIQTVGSAYKDVLGRRPDYPAAFRHAKNFLENPAALPLKTLSLYTAFAQSPEGKRRWAAQDFQVPRVILEALPADDA